VIETGKENGFGFHARGGVWEGNAVKRLGKAALEGNTCFAWHQNDLNNSAPLKIKILLTLRIALLRLSGDG